MKYKWLRTLLPAAALCVFTSTLFSQEDIFRNGIQFGVGARAIAMGGAYSAVGEDYTASFWNPAALAQIRRFEFTGGVTHLQRENLASFNSEISTNDEFNKTRLSEIGFAYPVPTYRGSMVLSFGYNRVKSFDSNFALSDVFNSLPDDSVSQSWLETETGSLNNWTVGGAIDLSPSLSAGVGLNFWSGNDNYSFTLFEDDTEDIYTFHDYRQDDLIDSQLSGFNMTFGALYHLNRAIRLSGTISTPTRLKITEAWQTTEETTFDEEDDEFVGDDGSVEYKIRSPLTATVGASVSFANFVVSGQLEFNDWTQIEFLTDPPIDDVSREDANQEIRNNYQATQRVRLGAEFTLPGTFTQLRAGYYFDPAIEIENDGVGDREYYSAGVGFLIDKQIKLDIAYVYGTWTEESGALNNFVTDLKEEVTLNKLFATVSFRF